MSSPSPSADTPRRESSLTLRQVIDPATLPDTSYGETIWKRVELIRFNLVNGINGIQEVVKLVDAGGSELPRYFIAVGMLNTQLGPRPIMAQIIAETDDEAFANLREAIERFHAEHSTSIVRTKPTPPPMWPVNMFPANKTPELKRA